MNRQGVEEPDTTCWMELMELMDETCQILAKKLNVLERENKKLESLLKVRPVVEGKDKQGT